MRTQIFTTCLLLSLVSLSSVGCKRALREAARKAAEGDNAAPITTAPTPQWKQDEVTFAPASGKGRFSIRGMAYEISLSDLPSDAKVNVADKAVVASGGTFSSKVDLTERMAALSPKDAFDTSFKLDPQIKLDVAFSPTAKVTLDAPPRPTFYVLSELFKKANDTPVTFPGNAKPAEHTILNTTLTTEVLGPAKTVKEIDWVAVSENLPARKGKTCSGYKKTGADKGPEKSYQLELVDQKLSVYEVATSKLIEEKSFKAKEDCPMMTFNGAAKSYPAQEEEKTWLRALRSKK